MTDETNDEAEPIEDLPTEQLSTNPMAERGFKLGPKDFELITRGLTLLGEAAKQHGEPQYEKHCANLIARLAENVHAGEGMNPAQIQAHGRRIEQALRGVAAGEAGADEAVVRAVGTMLASMVRLEADPAFKVGMTCSQLVQAGTIETGKAMALAALSSFQALLQSAQADWTAEGWSAAGTPEVVQWILDMLSIGIDNVREGHAPWPADG